MPTTSNFGWTTPADTDLVKDGAAAIRTLGNGIDTSFIDLKGGTTGQVLSKASNTDLDYSWVTPNVGDITEVQAGTGISVASGTGPIPVVTNTVATAYDAKGDLIVGTGADTFARLAVGGTNGHTLQIDSSTATGLKWDAAATGVTFAGCSVSNVTTGTISVADSTYVSVTFDTEQYDTDGYHSTATNTSRMTIPAGKAGYYLLTGRMRWDANTTGSRYIIFSKNGTNYDSTGSAIYASMYQIHSIVLYLAVGDYVELQGYQDSGGTRTLNVNQDQSRFTISYLGA